MTMTKYHAVMQGEDGSEFGADVETNTRAEAYDELWENYPESSVVQLESPSDTRRRKDAMYARLENEMDQGW